MSSGSRRKAKMLIRVDDEIKAGIKSFVAELRMKNPKKNVTENQAVAVLLKRCAPDIWEKIRDQYDKRGEIEKLDKE